MRILKDNWKMRPYYICWMQELRQRFSVQSFLLSQLIIFPPLISMNLLLMQRPIISLPHTKKHFPWCYMLPPTLVFVFWHL